MNRHIALKWLWEVSEGTYTIMKLPMAILKLSAVYVTIFKVCATFRTCLLNAAETLRIQRSPSKWFLWRQLSITRMLPKEGPAPR